MVIINLLRLLNCIILLNAFIIIFLASNYSFNTWVIWSQELQSVSHQTRGSRHGTAHPSVPGTIHGAWSRYLQPPEVGLGQSPRILDHSLIRGGEISHNLSLSSLRDLTISSLVSASSSAFWWYAKVRICSFDFFEKHLFRFVNNEKKIVLKTIVFENHSFWEEWK